MNCMKCGTLLSSDNVCFRCARTAASRETAKAVAISSTAKVEAVTPSTFQVIFTGLRSDVMRDEAIQRLAALFQASLEQIKILLTASEHVLKGGLSAEHAVRMQAAIKAAGGICRIAPEKRQAIVSAKPQTVDASVDQPASPWMTAPGIDIRTANWEEAKPYYDAVIAGDLGEPDPRRARTPHRQARRERYLRSFEKAHGGAVLTRFNWSAFFFTSMWAAFRRMPVLAYGCLALMQVATPFLFLHLMSFQGRSISVEQLFSSLTFYSIGVIVIGFLFGMFGDYLYYRSARARILTVHSLPCEQAIASLKPQGGTRAWACWMLIGVSILYGIFVQPIWQGAVQRYAQRESGPLAASAGGVASATLPERDNLRDPEETASGVRRGQFTLAKVQELAEQGNVSAQLMLGYLHAKGEGIKQDYQQAAVWYWKAAEQGNAQAQSLLAYYYIKGQGVPQDYHEAVHWLRKAAEQGNAGAQYNLGLMYKKGLGVSQDHQEAMAWFKKASESEQGNQKLKQMAQNNMGVVQSEGQGVPKDDQQAMAWYRKAAEQGHATAQTNLGGMYETGRGVPQDYQQAMTWYLRAAQQNDPNAQFRLGMMFDAGRGTKRDDRQAVEWFSKASEQGHVQAQYHLGVKYANGHGVDKDMVAALKWFTLAAPKDSQAEAARVRAESEMTMQQIQEARNRAEAWKAASLSAEKAPSWQSTRRI